jgi:hypothetical protein
LFLVITESKIFNKQSKSALDNVHRNLVKNKAAFDSRNPVELFRWINETQALGVEDFSGGRRSPKKDDTLEKDTNHLKIYQQVETSCFCTKYILSHIFQSVLLAVVEDPLYQVV